jgi:hypothetical protein
LDETNTLDGEVSESKIRGVVSTYCINVSLELGDGGSDECALEFGHLAERVDFLYTGGLGGKSHAD